MAFEKDQHPRLYFSREALPTLRAQAASGVRAAILSRMRAWCERFLDPADPHYFDFRERRRPCWKERELRMVWEPAMHLLAFTYAFTGEERFGETAVAALMNAIETRLADVRYHNMGVEYEGWRRSTIHQHDKGMYAWAVCHVYDLCYDLLNEAQRQAAREHIIESIHILDDRALFHNDYAFITTNRGARAFVGVRGMYPLAIEGDADVPRTEAFLQEALHACDKYLHSAFDQDGVCFDGPSYAGALTHAHAFARMLERSGRGSLLRHPIWEKFLHHQLYELVPGGSRLNNLNDCDALCGTVKPALFLMGTPAGAVIPWMARQLDLHPRRLRGEGKDEADAVNALFDLMFPLWLWEWHEEEPVRDPRQLGYPLSRCFPQRGIASMRTGWGAEDALLSHKCGLEPHRQHRQSDQNHLAFYAMSESFLVDEGYGRTDAVDEKGAAPPPRYFSQAGVHNVILVDGQEPNPLFRGGGLAGGQIVDWRHTPEYDTSMGDATGAHLLDRAVDRALRRVVLVRRASGPFVLVVDEVVVDETNQPHLFEALWRTAPSNRIEVQGGRFVIGGTTNDCHGQVLYPETTELAVKTHYMAPQLRVKVRAPRLEMVTVLTPVRRGEDPPRLTCERHGPGDFTVTLRTHKVRWTVRAGTRREGPLHCPVAVEVRQGV